MLPSDLSRLSPEAQLEVARRRVEVLKERKAAVPANLAAAPWIETYFYIPELKGPLRFAPYQRAVLNEALTPDADGNFKYSTIVWSDIKK
jgi:hypothetical protein